MKTNLLAIVTIICCLIVLTITWVDRAQPVHAQTDPNPRFEMLGREELDGNKTGQPAKVFVYLDKGTGNEILCFAGEYRETLSCFTSGRKR